MEVEVWVWSDDELRCACGVCVYSLLITSFELWIARRVSKRLEMLGLVLVSSCLYKSR